MAMGKTDEPAMSAAAWDDSGGISPPPFQGDWKTEGLAILDANGLRIASLAFNGKPISQKVTGEQQMANYRLFLAAPTLLDAAERYYEALESSHMKCDVENDDEECYAEQYGDGNAEEHVYMRDLGGLLGRLGVRKPDPALVCPSCGGRLVINDAEAIVYCEDHPDHYQREA